MVLIPRGTLRGMTQDQAPGAATRTKQTRRRIVVDDTPLARRIGQRLRRARLAAGLTQQQLAEGRYTKAYISALETGQSKPSMAALNFLAARLGMQASRFLEDEPAALRRLDADIALASGRWNDAVDGYRALLEQAPSREVRAEVLSRLAEALDGLDQGAEATACAGEAAQLFIDLGRAAEAAVARYWMAAGEFSQGNVAEAESILRGLLDQVRGGLRVEPDFELRLVMGLSSAASLAGRHDVALAYLEEIRGLADALDDHRRATFLFELSYSYRETGDYEAAIRAGVASLALFRASTFDAVTASLENDLSLSYLAVGNMARARELAASAQARYERLGDRRQLAHVLETQAQIAFQAGAVDDARDRASEALAVAEETGNQKAEVSSLLSLARVHRASGDPVGAAPLYERAVSLARTSGRPGLIRDAIGEWADVLADSGRHEEATALLREALRAV